MIRSAASRFLLLLTLPELAACGTKLEQPRSYFDTDSATLTQDGQNKIENEADAAPSSRTGVAAHQVVITLLS